MYYPSIEEIERYLIQLRQTHYHPEDIAIKSLFGAYCPSNEDLSSILIKIATLNQFYSTNILSVYDVAKHIYDLNSHGASVDSRLQAGDLSLVQDIASVSIGGKERCFYSFATKYCANHCPTLYPIYDSFVDCSLWAFQRRDKFYNFKRGELKDYPKFKAIVDAFVEYYQIPTSVSYRELDHYLWLLGKDIKRKNICI